ncbi:universal stress protein [Halovivax gelatinilyticus]|uniref:universal stress protein n=1 Tax=Halovivax gelatinilyticus TaxID=2961597 RepID=UPI0020CA2D98|nr:universal stress protein [Halovivax gelatinilyticus]
MSDTVLVPVDGSDPSKLAIDFAIEHFSGSSIAIIYVMNPLADYSRVRAFPGYTASDEYSTEREKGEAVIASAVDRIPDDVDVETDLIVGKPSRAIITYADDAECSHIVIGSHGRTGTARHLLGSVAETVVRRASTPVTVVRPTDST